ncbi:MAG: hypothetical protein ACREQ5_15010, partial [Candidatus Dormibacteria bacterium]
LAQAFRFSFYNFQSSVIKEGSLDDYPKLNEIVVKIRRLELTGEWEVQFGLRDQGSLACSIEKMIEKTKKDMIGYGVEQEYEVREREMKEEQVNKIIETKDRSDDANETK